MPAHSFKIMATVAVLILFALIIILYLDPGYHTRTGEHQEFATLGQLDPFPAEYTATPEDSLPQISLLAGDYWEQMTMAMNSMFRLATIAKVWNATFPIPFTSDSHLYGLPTGKQNLDTIYDIKKLLHLVKLQFNITVFTTFEQFLNTSSRKVIGVEVKQNAIAGESYHIYNVDCHSNMDHGLLNNLNSEASKRSFNLSLEPFHLVKCCHIIAGRDTSPQEISRLCGFYEQGGAVTILIKQWRGVARIPTSARLYMKQFSMVPYPNPRYISFPHSANIIHSSSKLLSSKLLNEHTKFIGVHLRSEKVSQTGKQSIYDECFELFYNLIQKLNHGLPVLYIGDSHTNSIFGKKMSKYGINLTEYRLTQDRGYRAQVEQAVLARAEILILVGGGSFQQQVYVRFRTYNSSGVAYRVCVEEAAPGKFLTASLIRNWQQPVDTA